MGKTTDQGPVVATTSGKVLGCGGHDIAVFRGIPYAAAPVGPNRFRPPVRPSPWDAIRDARAFGPVVPQGRVSGVLGEVLASPVDLPQGDDCLTLNVWTPGLHGEGLPVLVWIHGGGFHGGSGADSIYDGSTFARDGIVCVTINYRLGAAGFLAVDGPGGGNFGLLDQIQALHWVQENISAFGGDPDAVTIAGESAGGISVGTLLATPTARGLFRRAISQSGGAGHHGLSLGTAQRIADEYYTMTGVAPGDLDALRAMSSSQLVGVQQALNEAVLATRDVDRFGLEVVASTMAFQPVFGTEVLPQRPLDAVRDGVGADVDLLVGHTRDELQLVFGLDPSVLGVDAATVELMADGMLDATFGQTAERASAHYRRVRSRVDPLALIAAVETDRMFRIPDVRLADAHSAAGGRTYFYRLSWPSPAFEGRIGACHALDLAFVWDNLTDPVTTRLTGEDPPVDLARDMHRAWVAFITEGEPGHADLPTWPTYGSTDHHVLEFDLPSTLLTDPYRDERRLWEGIV